MYQTARSTMNRLFLASILWAVLLADAAHADDAVATGSFLATLDHATYFERAAALHGLLEYSDTTDLQSYLVAARGIQRVGMRKAWSGIVYARYTQIDPQGAVDHILQTGDDYQLEYLYATFCNWAEVDPEAAIARSQQLVRLPQRSVAKQAILAAHVELDAAALTALSERLGGRSESGIEAVLALRIERLAASDPRAAMAQAMAISDIELRKPLLQAIGRSWAAQAPEQALLASEDLSDAASRQAYREGVITELALSHPDALLAELDSSQYSDGEQYGIVNYVFSDLGVSNPLRGIALASRISTAYYRMVAYSTLFSVLPQGDPALTLELLEQSGSDLDDMTVESKALTELMLSEPGAALQWANRNPQRGRRWTPYLISLLSAENPSRALREALELSEPQVRIAALLQVIQTLAELDPLAAMEAIELLPPSAQRVMTQELVVTRWVTQDAPAATRWLLSQPEPLRSRLLQSGFGDALIRIDPELAQTVYQEFDSLMMEEWARKVVQRKVSDDPEQAARWLLANPDWPGFESAAQMVAGQLAGRDPQAALAFVAELPSDDAHDKALSAVIGVWSSTDAVAAAAFVAGVPSSPLRNSLVMDVTESWASFDFEKARRWLLSLDDLEARDETLVMLVSNAGIWGVDPMDLVDDIHSDAQRESALSALVQTLAYQNPEGARALLKRSDLPPGFSAQWSPFVEEAASRR